MKREINNSPVNIDLGEIRMNQSMQISEIQLKNTSRPKRRVRSHIQQSNEEEPYANLKDQIRMRKARKLTHEQCPVCFSQYKKGDLIEFASCKHKYCRACLRLHIQSSIKTFSPIKCLEEDCPEILQIQSPHIISLPIAKRQKYYQILAFANTSKDPSIKLCPTEGCYGFIDVNFDPVSCAICQIIFCKKCLMNFHQGECDQNGVDFLQKTFLFRRCSKCRMVLQKNQGCNHMTCKCGHQFCYICGGNWNGHNKCSPPTNPPAVRMVPAPIIIPPSIPNVPILPRNITVPNVPIVSNAPIAPIASNVSSLPNSNVDSSTLPINANSQQILQRSTNRISIAPQRQGILLNNGFCSCFKCFLAILLCFLVNISTLQFIIVVGLSATFFLVEIFVFLYSIPLGGVRMFERYSWREMLLGNIFLLVHCIGCQFWRKTKQFFSHLTRQGVFCLFPLSSMLFTCLTQ